MSEEPIRRGPGSGRGVLDGRSIAVGLLLGALAAGGVAVLVTSARRGASVPESPFSIDEDHVRLKPGVGQPMTFVVAPVTDGPPLPRPADVARVAAVEARSAASFAPLEGRVERVAVVLGDRVKERQRLVLVRSGDLASMLRELRGTVIAAQTKKALVERLKLLVETRAAADNELLIARSEYEEAQLAARAAESRLRSLAIAEEGDNLYWVVAARAGTVVQINVQPGQYVGPNRDRPVATVADLDEILVLADVPERDTGGIRPGTSAQVHTPGQAGAPIDGVVETISEVVDADRQTVPVRIRCDNRRRALRPNAFVEAVFLSDPLARVLIVPAEAVVSDGLDAVVFVETAAGAYQRREVVVGRRGGDRVEVASGLRLGERIVTRGALLLLNAIDMQD